MPKVISQMSPHLKNGKEEKINKMKKSPKNNKLQKSPKRLKRVLDRTSKVLRSGGSSSPNTSVSSYTDSLKKMKKVFVRGDKKKNGAKKREYGEDSFSSSGSKASSINNSIRTLISSSGVFGKKDARKKMKMDSDLPPKPALKNTPKSCKKGSSNTFTPQPTIPLPPSTPTTTTSTSDTNPWTQHLQQGSLHDSRAEASKLFDYLIQPVSSDKFFRDIWEKKPLLVRRHNPHYNDGLFSVDEFDRILREEHLSFSQNIDVVTYDDGVRNTHNPDGPARAPLVWNFYQQGCSVRLLNPQSYNHPTHATLALLQEHFSSMAGANVYLTPPGSQGFAPHYDDIEAFVVQLEGSKAWKVYEPATEELSLPRVSSRNFGPSELGDPVLDVVLERGDMLYFPRGFIHQASTPTDSHSLHMTISVAQKNTWADLLSILVPRALELAVEECVELRESLPTDYLHYMGIVHSEEENKKRTNFNSKLSQLFSSLLQHAPIDSAVDQMAKKYLSTSLPPCLTQHEKECTIEGVGMAWGVGEEVVCSELTPSTQVKVIRKGCIRLVTEEQVFIYHNLDNTRLFEETSCPPIQVSSEEAEIVEVLIKKYPDFVKVEDLLMEDAQAKLDLMQLLYDRGILVTKEPLSHKET